MFENEKDWAISSINTKGGYMKELLEDLYVHQSKTLQEVADAIGVSRPTAKKYLLNNGIELRKHKIHKKNRPDITADSIISLANDGLLVNEIADKYGVSRSCINLRLKEVGISLRNHKNQTRLQSERMKHSNPIAKGSNRTNKDIGKMKKGKEKSFNNMVSNFFPKNYHEYAKMARFLSYRKLKNKTPEGKEIDHIYSCKSGYLNNVPVSIISNEKNTQFLTPNQNKKKGCHDGITLEELYNCVGVQRLSVME